MYFQSNWVSHLWTVKQSKHSHNLIRHLVIIISCLALLQVHRQWSESWTFHEKPAEADTWRPSSRAEEGSSLQGLWRNYDMCLASTNTKPLSDSSAPKEMLMSHYFLYYWNHMYRGGYTNKSFTCTQVPPQGIELPDNWLVTDQLVYSL